MRDGGLMGGGEGGGGGEGVVVVVRRGRPIRNTCARRVRRLKRVQFVVAQETTHARHVNPIGAHRHPAPQRVRPPGIEPGSI